MTDNFAKKFYSADASQRLGPLIRIPGLLGDFGVPIKSALKGTGIEPAAFSDPENRISYRQGSRLLERCAKMTRCQDFGLLLGSRSDHRDLGLVGQLMANARNLEAALLSFVGVQQLNSRGASTYVHHSHRHWVWGYGIYEPDAVAQEQIYATTVAIMANCVRVLTGGAVAPVEVILPFRQPDDTGPYVALLGAPVRFNQREAGIVLPRSALDAPIPNANPTELERMHKLIASRMPASDKVWTERVNHAIRPLILRGQPTTAHMAAMLGVNVRMLARRLEREGTTFQTLLDVVRYGMARELLLITDLTVGDIADALAYAHQSSFGDAFVRWSGMAPKDWRTAHFGHAQGR
jgi:AraC-like DNA-binding protein